MTFMILKETTEDHGIITTYLNAFFQKMHALQKGLTALCGRIKPLARKIRSDSKRFRKRPFDAKHIGEQLRVAPVDGDAINVNSPIVETVTVPVHRASKSESDAPA